MKPLKIAHTEGHTDVCYDSTGSFILTGGGDGKVCILEGCDDTDTTTVKIGDKVYSLGFHGGRFFAATDENTIRIHTFPDGVGDGMVTRFTAPCRHFCLCDDGSMLVAGSDDFKIKVISLEENECICLYAEHQAPVLSIAIDPSKEFIASSSCDGSVKIWNIIDGSTEKSVNLFTKCSEPSQAKSQCRMCWSQDGEFLLIPVGHEIHVFLRSSWEVVRKLSSSDITEVINVLIMCPDGKHIAVGCVNGDMGIFEWQTSRLLEKQSHPKHLTITSMAWNPKNWGEVAFTDNMGQLGFLDVAVTSAKAVAGSASQAVTGEMTFDDADDDMLVSASGHPTNGDDIDKFLDEDSNSIDIGSIKRSLNPHLDNDDADSFTSSRAEEGRPAQLVAPVMPFPTNIFKPTPLQPPFQPGSTPEHLSSRFMVWNSVGIVRQYISDDENSVDVEFHDTTTHHALHIDNKSDYVMAALSTQALVLASRGEEDIGSKLFCMHFGSWDSHKEWSYDMPAGENIQAITLTDTWVAIATESRTVRIFSVGGLQCQVFSLAGNVVALSSHGNKLLAVYHKGMGIPGDQFLGVSVMHVKGRTRRLLINGDTLPLSPASKLSWIGWQIYGMIVIYSVDLFKSFSEEGTPFSMDYDGVIRMFNKQAGSLWFPVANSKEHVKGKSDHYWLVGVCERQEQIRCIPCKGSRYPATLPRPALAVLPFQLPLCDMSSEKSQHEESYLRSYLFSKNLVGSGLVDEEDLEKPVKEAVIKLFAFAAKSERNFRAVEVCDLMEDQNLLHIAATYATRLKRMQLAERVSEIMHKRLEAAEQEDDGETVDGEEELAETEYGEDTAFSGQSQQNADSDDDMDVSTDNTVTDDSDKKTPSGPLLKTHIEIGQKSKEKSFSRPNPFRVSSSSDRKSTKGSQVFDKMEKTTPKASPIIAPLPVSIKKSNKKQSNSNQPKLLSFRKNDKKAEEKKQTADQESPVSVKQELLTQTPEDDISENQPVKKKIGAFDLWLEANLSDLREEHPDLSEDDLRQQATEAFRTLPKEERQIWVQKAKSGGQSDSDASKKRKLSTDDTDRAKGAKEESKKIKSESAAERKQPLSQATNAKLARFAKND